MGSSGRTGGTTAGTFAAGDDARLTHPTRAAVSGSYFALSCHPIATAATTLTLAKDTWRFMPLVLRTALALSGLAVVTTSAASGGTAAMIFGLFACDASMRPSTRQADWSSYGSIDLTATAGQVNLATASLTVPAGEWWVGCAWTGTATVSPAFSAHNTMHPSISSGVAVTNGSGLLQSVSGATVPTSVTPAANANAGVIIFAKNA